MSKFFFQFLHVPQVENTEDAAEKESHHPLEDMDSDDKPDNNELSRTTAESNNNCGEQDPETRTSSSDSIFPVSLKDPSQYRGECNYRPYHNIDLDPQNSCHSSSSPSPPYMSKPQSSPVPLTSSNSQGVPGSPPTGSVASHMIPVSNNNLFNNLQLIHEASLRKSQTLEG